MFHKTPFYLHIKEPSQVHLYLIKKETTILIKDPKPSMDSIGREVKVCIFN